MLKRLQLPTGALPGLRLLISDGCSRVAAFSEATDAARAGLYASLYRLNHRVLLQGNQHAARDRVVAD